MEKSIKQITFDEVMLSWLEAEINNPRHHDILDLAQAKGFSSITEWRLNIALRLGLDKKDWTLETLTDPSTALGKIIIGPYQGWSQFFENQFSTTFEQAMQIPDFFEWCQTHDRIIPISKNFPEETTLIALRNSKNELIHIEGGHRICATVYATKIGQPIDFNNRTVDVMVASIADQEIDVLKKFLTEGTLNK